MKLDVTLFKNKVARRMFILFVVTALIPVALLALLTFNQVTRHLSKQTQMHLHQNTKSIGWDIFQKLSNLNQELDRLAKQFVIEPDQTLLLQNLRRDDRYIGNFVSLGVFSKEGLYTPVFGNDLKIPPLTQEQIEQHLKKPMYPGLDLKQA